MLQREQQICIAKPERVFSPLVGGKGEMVVDEQCQNSGLVGMDEGKRYGGLVLCECRSMAGQARNV